MKPPELFNFKMLDEWPLRHWFFWAIAYGIRLCEGSSIKQVIPLLNCPAEDVESVLNSKNATENERNTMTLPWGSLTLFSEVRRSVIYKQAQVNRWSLEPGETSEQFIMALNELADNCKYGEMKDEMICDEVVSGIRDNSLFVVIAARSQAHVRYSKESCPSALRHCMSRTKLCSATGTMSSIAAAVQPGGKQWAQNGVMHNGSMHAHRQNALGVDKSRACKETALQNMSSATNVARETIWLQFFFPDKDFYLPQHCEQLS